MILLSIVCIANGVCLYCSSRLFRNVSGVDRTACVVPVLISSMTICIPSCVRVLNVVPSSLVWLRIYRLFGGKQSVCSVPEMMDAQTSGSYSAKAAAATSPVRIVIGSIVIVIVSPVWMLVMYPIILSIVWICTICVELIAVLNIAAISPNASNSIPVNGLSNTCAYAMT